MKMPRAEILGWTLFFAALAVFATATGNRYFLALLVFSLIGSINALGMNLLLGFAGQISLGQSAFYALGAYASALLTIKFGIPFALSLPASILDRASVEHSPAGAWHRAVSTLAVRIVCLPAAGSPASRSDQTRAASPQKGERSGSGSGMASISMRV